MWMKNFVAYWNSSKPRKCQPFDVRTRSTVPNQVVISQWLWFRFRYSMFVIYTMQICRYIGEMWQYLIYLLSMNVHIYSWKRYRINPLITANQLRSQSYPSILSFRMKFVCGQMFSSGLFSVSIAEVRSSVVLSCPFQFDEIFCIKSRKYTPDLWMLLLLLPFTTIGLSYYLWSWLNLVRQTSTSKQ